MGLLMVKQQNQGTSATALVGFYIAYYLEVDGYLVFGLFPPDVEIAKRLQLRRDQEEI